MTTEQRNAEILRILDEQTKRNTVSRKIARDALIDEGIYTKRGQVRAEFGGGVKKKGSVPA
jgi:hypothetical protein